ncbi:esterase/lipase family protein [Pandoraea bronchicola]|uniref:Lipoprotein n=1 Tax=Pandoraea bronchicola TaxID=2508287 RepID=A0A5E5BP26_9BURK|nr:alpha/beta fold hydrolase [Pandoraea bronchicola]VVE87056.1 lipoprotein [Pandoraea bronchicola]
MTSPAIRPPAQTFWRRRLHRAAMLAAAVWLTGLSGCAMVEVRSLGPDQYIAMKRGDILSTGKLSASTDDVIRVAGLDETICAKPSLDCIDALGRAKEIDIDRRLAAMAEMSMQLAIAQTPAGETQWNDAQFDLWLRSARYAYAYLFHGDRRSSERAFEDRQTQVRDYYNYAVQTFSVALFRRVQQTGKVQIAGWTLPIDASSVRFANDRILPREVLPASTLSFAGLRSPYRRDGFGAELVAVLDEKSAADALTSGSGSPAPRGDAATGLDNRQVSSEQNEESGGARNPRESRASRDFRRATDPEAGPVFSEMPSPSLTLLLRFDGTSLAQVLTTRVATLVVYDPYRQSSVELNGQTVPLAGNFTAGYGLWLARSGFAQQSLRTLFGRDRGIVRPHIYLMQPFDPGRHVILMLHGLASSPEAWVNLANEIQGDATLREHFQIWQVYYPTNAPILVNAMAIRNAFEATLKHFDPDGLSAASHGAVVIGHSMGGVIARLMVSSADDELWSVFQDDYHLDDHQVDRARGRLNPLFQFKPVPQFERAIFIAAPHRGTPFARNRLGRWVSNLIKLPVTLLSGIDDVLHFATGTEDSPSDGKTGYVPNSVDQLRDNDPYVVATAGLKISPSVQYHSIIARRDPKGPLEESSDGVVPYKSAHLAGAQSERVIVSGHSVQETPQAILEIRRILHEDVDELDPIRRPGRPGPFQAINPPPLATPAKAGTQPNSTAGRPTSR